MKKIEFDADELNLIELAQQYSDETKARALLESLRWPNGAICPHCQCDDVYKLTPKPKAKKPSRIKERKQRQGLYCCAACRKQFTVTVGTVFEASHIPITKWVMAMFILCSSKKSISAHQLHRMLKITYKTAWFMAHRIRYAMNPSHDKAEKLKGIVEIDETYVGGKGDMSTKVYRKTPVVALIQRGGDMRTAVVHNVTQKNMFPIIGKNIHPDTIINTDESSLYQKHLQKHFKRHDVVNHSKVQYYRRNEDGTCSGVNSCESFFSLLKRGVHGAWHHVSREHLPKYAGEFAFRWNHRHISDGLRFVRGIESIEGKRLTYRQAV